MTRCIQIIEKCHIYFFCFFYTYPVVVSRIEKERKKKRVWCHKRLSLLDDHNSQAYSNIMYKNESKKG